jgi:L-seryl-tRNA(Ser) seleniumtransferase
MDKKLFRQIPQVGELAGSPEFGILRKAWSQVEIVSALRILLEGARAGLYASGALPDFASDAFVEEVEAELKAQKQLNLRRVINGTGIIIHTNLGRAPLAPGAIQAMQDVAHGYANIEYDLEQGRRGSRYDHIRDILRELTGAEDAVVVNNCAAAPGVNWLKSAGRFGCPTSFPRTVPCCVRWARPTRRTLLTMRKP